MKIDDAIIDKVLNNGASVEEAGLVAEWFATEEGTGPGMVRPSGAGRTDVGTLHRANKT